LISSLPHRYLYVHHHLPLPPPIVATTAEPTPPLL
jgi:hypothetical protein